MPVDFVVSDVSVVPIDEALITKVSVKANVPIERVRSYLRDTADQDETLLRAFLFYGVGPFGKTL
jgi:hypothetical protein